MLSSNLYDFVKDKYTLEIVTANRVAWYEEIFQKNKKNNQILAESVSN
jgi:hypothetical protein